MAEKTLKTKQSLCLSCKHSYIDEAPYGDDYITFYACGLPDDEIERKKTEENENFDTIKCNRYDNLYKMDEAGKELYRQAYQKGLEYGHSLGYSDGYIKGKKESIHEITKQNPKVLLKEMLKEILSEIEAERKAEERSLKEWNCGREPWDIPADGSWTTDIGGSQHDN